jgi:hypothetical protein
VTARREWAAAAGNRPRRSWPRAGGECAGARALVLRGAVLDDVAVAPVLPVGEAHLGGFEEGVQLAAVGVRAAAGVAVAAAAVGANDGPVGGS